MPHKMNVTVVVLTVVALMAFASLSASAAPPDAPSQQQGDSGEGAYIVALASGCGCHSGEAGFLAGGETFEGPFGVVYARNITPHEETGIGGWTDQEIINAVQLGRRPDGTQLHPIMPYPAFSGMADEDVADLIAFLRTVEPVENSMPPRSLSQPVPPFEAQEAPPAEAPTEGVERGAYIVNAISHCGDCHTPTTEQGAPDMSMQLAGAFNPGLGGVIPNITPDAETGIGNWTETEIATFLQTGQRPDGSQVGGLMAQIIDLGVGEITDQDASAVAAYLKTVPAVANEVQAPPEMEVGAAAEEEEPEMPQTGGEQPTVDMVALALLIGGLLLAASFILRRSAHWV